MTRGLPAMPIRYATQYPYQVVKILFTEFDLLLPNIFAQNLLYKLIAEDSAFPLDMSCQIFFSHSNPSETRFSHSTSTYNFLALINIHLFSSPY